MTFPVVLRHLARLLLGGLFLYAGIVKMLDPIAFAGQIAAYQLLPYSLNLIVAATLPAIEILCGALLVANRQVRPAALVLFLLNLVFVVFLASAIVRGLNIDCGCFRPGESSSPSAALLRDLVLIGLAVIVLRTPPPDRS